MILGLILVAAAGAMFFALRPGDSEESTPGAGVSTTDGVGTTSSESGNEVKPVKPKKPAVPTIVIRDGEPVGGVLAIDVREGDRIRFKVKSDVEEEVHVHGFDINRDVAPGKVASLDFGADFTGIFEAELEFSGLPIAEIQINP